MGSIASRSIATEAIAGSQNATPLERYAATAAMIIIPPIAQETPTVCASLKSAVTIVARNSRTIGSR
jgi:hypothetical protein